MAQTDLLGGCSVGRRMPEHDCHSPTHQPRPDALLDADESEATGELGVAALEESAATVSARPGTGACRELDPAMSGNERS